jgi:hypothetical protein
MDKKSAIYVPVADFYILLTKSYLHCSWSASLHSRWNGRSLNRTQRSSAIGEQDPKCQHLRRPSSFSDRKRRAILSIEAEYRANTHLEQDNSDCFREARSTWVCLVRKIFEVDPLVGACGARIQIVSFITHPRVVDRCKAKDPCEPRAPPISFLTSPIFPCAPR